MLSAADHFESAAGFLERGDSLNCLWHLQAGLLIDPSNVGAWANRANILARNGHQFEALVSYDRALSILPKEAVLWSNRAATLCSLNQHDQALESVERALELEPNLHFALGAKANILYLRGDYLGAADWYQRAIKIQYDHDWRLFRSMALLATGKFKEGWAEYESRRESSGFSKRILPAPYWNGEAYESILVINEQGHGDALQFMRLARMLKQRHGGKVYLEVRRPLARIVHTMRGIDGVIAFGDELPKVDYYVSAMSLPHLLGLHSESDIPNEPYFSACGRRSAIWEEQLCKAMPGKFRVGLCWAGQSRMDLATKEVDARRSTKLAFMEPLGSILGIGFVSLQVGKESTQALNSPFPILDLTSEIEDFYDTAALIECLDLVISVDTSVVHLTGALGKPVWLLSRFDNCWRWLGDREDSPWYPSLRQFRQKKWGDWPEVMTRVAYALADYFKLREAA